MKALSALKPLDVAPAASYLIPSQEAKVSGAWGSGALWHRRKAKLSQARAEHVGHRLLWFPPFLAQRQPKGKAAASALAGQTGRLSRAFVCRASLGLWLLLDLNQRWSHVLELLFEELPSPVPPLLFRGNRGTMLGLVSLVLP